jgi:hypothetical protein
MNPVLGSVIVAACLAVLAWIVLRRPSPHSVADYAVVAFLGVAASFGALLFQTDVSTYAWVLTPVVVVGLALVHFHFMVLGDGPLRT